MKVIGKLKNAELQNNKTTFKIETEGNFIPTLERQNTQEIEILIPDPRKISSDQRKKAYATINDIAVETGHYPEFLKEYFKYSLMIETGTEYFSLSDCSVTVAKEYITHIIDFAIEWGIPLQDLSKNRVEDIDRYIYKCLATRTCAISGKRGAEIHHCLGSRVGMGRNRNKIDHSDLEIIPLSRYWHNRVHAEGEKEIFQEYKIYGIKVDRQTLRNLGLRTKEIS